MADNYLENQYEQYQARKAAWEKSKKHSAGKSSAKPSQSAQPTHTKNSPQPEPSTQAVHQPQAASPIQTVQESQSSPESSVSTLTPPPLHKTIFSWLNILLGCTILAVGFVFFINPYNIVPGGVYGASIVLHNLFPSIQVGTFGYMFDVPLLILSVVLLGAKLGTRTIAAALVTPLIMNVISTLVYPTREALEALDPALLLGGCMNMTDHLMLTSIIGATLIGIGTGIVIRNQATTGGSDIVGMLLQKYCHIRFSNAILLVDGTVVCFGLVVIGFGIGSADDLTQPSWHLSFYSLISIFIISRVISYVINGAKNDKLIFVISEHELTRLHQYILVDLDRTATCIKSSGLYTGQDKEMLFLVVSYKEVNQLKAIIKEADPNAFVVVTDAYDTFGAGWKQLPSMGEVQPE